MTLRTNRFWLPVVPLVFAACGGGGTSPPDGGQAGGGSGGRAGSGGSVGSGGGNGGSIGKGGAGGATADATTPFVGSWTFDSGSVTPMCTGVTVAAITLTGNAVSITRIDASHIGFSFSNSELSCNVDFTVSGTTATAEPSQTCSISVMGVSTTFDVSSWVLTESGNTISMTVSGTAKVAVVNCTPSGTGMLGRVGAAG
jgi:hypothetical protein